MALEGPDVSAINDSIRINLKIKEKAMQEKKFYRATKRIVDILLSAIGLVVLSPVFLTIGIIVKLDSKGTVFFKHKRIGKNGEEIYIYKFRTMISGAEQMIKNFDEEQMKEFKENYKLEHDPRVTKVGDFLRKTSLDELPQIWNIFKGDLSIVGPRPITKEET